MALVECADCKEQCDYKSRAWDAQKCWCCRLLREMEDERDE